MADPSEYKVGIVLSCEEVAKKGGKPLKVLTVDVGSGDEAVPVVTSAPNVREGSRVVVALAGSAVVGDDGEEMTLSKTSIAGHPSWGMICDSKMLGWSGGAAGVAVQLDDSFPVGSAPPDSKPRPKQQEQEELPAGPVTDGLFEKKLSKEEKKKLAAEKRAAKKAAKEGKIKSREVPCTGRGNLGTVCRTDELASGQRITN
eukprot:scaffold4844_cov112-Cylindrotheca_fusiformis.AAC.2